jgi:RimJ/RimL family protein N-acetyltransferase
VIETVTQLLCKYRKSFAKKYIWENGKVAFRPLRLDDLNKTYLRWLNDRKVNRFLARQSYDFEGMVDYYEKLKCKPRKNVFLALCDRLNGRHIGNVTLTNMKKKSAVLGIMIGAAGYRGKGWGRQAVKSICDYGFKKLGLRKIKLGTMAQNRAAVEAFRKAGFKIVKMAKSLDKHRRIVCQMEIQQGDKKR